jgi:uncharacterized protein
LYSGYGVWNAYHPRIHHLTVRVKDLPPDWKGKKIVQLSDVHLGRILGAQFLAMLMEKINAQSPAAVFITGDLFDGSDGRLDQLVAPLDGIVAPWGIFFVTGNHETYLATERAYKALKRTKARIPADELVVVNGMQILGVAYPQRESSKDLAAIAAGVGYDPALPSILLFHSPVQTERVKSAGINLQLAGHTHHGQIFPFQFVTRRVFGKYHRGLHIEGGYAIYTSSGAGTWGPAMRTGNRPEIALIRLE